MTQRPHVGTFLTLYGVPRNGQPEPGELCYFRDPQGAWRSSDGDRLDEIESRCIRVHDGLAAALFGGLENYYAILPVVPTFFFEAGLNSESVFSREDFEQLIAEFRDFPHLNRLLYLYDCRKLVTGVQECTKEVCYLVGEFYRILNLEELFFPPSSDPDGLRYLTSPPVTTLIATLSFIYIRLHSLLDYITKLVFEVEHLRTDFTTYPKLSSSKIQFGDRRRTGWGEPAGTLFEPGEPIDEIELIRNLVIHDGLFDDMPKVYKLVQNGQVVEKFVLMPDRTGARLDRFKNRSFFYSREDKINLRLPLLLNTFQAKQVATLDRVAARLFEISSTRPTPETKSS